MHTKGNCQPKGNSEQQPDANRTLASDAAATQSGCSDVDGRRQTVGSLALGYLKGLPDLSRNRYPCRLSWEVARKQGTIEDPHFSEAGFESICACSLSACWAIDYIGAMVIFGGAMLRTQRLHPWATTCPPAKANIAAVCLCHQHDQTHKPSAGRDDVVYLPLYICYTYLIIFDVGEDIYSIHIQIFIDTCLYTVSALSISIYIYIYAACISRELDMDMSLYTSISIYIYRSL